MGSLARGLTKHCRFFSFSVCLGYMQEDLKAVLLPFLTLLPHLLLLHAPRPIVLQMLALCDPSSFWSICGKERPRKRIFIV